MVKLSQFIFPSSIHTPISVDPLWDDSTPWLASSVGNSNWFDMIWKVKHLSTQDLTADYAGRNFLKDLGFTAEQPDGGFLLSERQQQLKESGQFSRVCLRTYEERGGWFSRSQVQTTAGKLPEHSGEVWPFLNLPNRPLNHRDVPIIIKHV